MLKAAAKYELTLVRGFVSMLSVVMGLVDIV